MLLLPDGSLLAATDTSGVWMVPVDRSPAICLSNSWAYATFCSVASGTFPGQFFAGGEALLVTIPGTPFPLMTWMEIPLPPDTGMIQRVLVLPDRIVLACENAMLWAFLPPPATTAFSWSHAEVHDGTGAIVKSPGFWDVAAGVRSVIQTHGGMIVSEEIMAGGVKGDSAGLFWGRWDQHGVLGLERAALMLTAIGRADFQEDTMAAVSVASCESDRRRAYALCTRPSPGDSPHVSFVVRSSDGGRIWAECGERVELDTPYSLGVLAGHQGSYNNCIAVANWDPDLVAFGFNNIFISFNGGLSWHPQGINGLNKPITKHLHVDIHGLRFTDNFPGASENLFVASDGGIAGITWGAGPWMIESDHRSDGEHGDFELLVLEGDTLMHYTRYSDNLGSGFKPGNPVSRRATAGACFVVSDYSTGGRQDYDAVVLEGNRLVHYWADNSTSPATWNAAQVISDSATGPGCIIQSDFATAGNRNFEVVVQEGGNLVHYWHEGPGRDGSWHKTPTPISTHAASGACFIQSGFGSGGHGNFELVVLEDGRGSQGAGIVHYWRDNSGFPYPWQGPTMIDRNATAQGCLFPTDLGANDFELVVQAGRELNEWRRDNSGFPYSWHFVRTILGPGPEYKATGPACAFQGSYHLDSPNGNFEMAACSDGNVVYRFRLPVWPDSTGWGFGPVISNQAYTYRSFWNRQFPILQFYGPTTGAYSTLGVSSMFAGLIGSGSQDNGVLYTTADHNGQGQLITPWYVLEGGDGGPAAFLASQSPLGSLPASGHVFIEYNNDEDKAASQPIGVRSCFWNNSQLVKYPAGNPVIPLGKVNPSALPPPHPKKGLMGPHMEIVTEPEFPGNLMYRQHGLLCALGAVAPDVYGLFVVDSADANNPSPPLRWDYIGTAMDASGVSLGVEALASRDGFSIVIGTAPLVKKRSPLGAINVGEIYRMDSASGNVSLMDMDPTLKSPIATDIVVISASEAYATTSQGEVIRWDGILWRATAALPSDAGALQAITADLSLTPPVIFVAGERRVFVSQDRGKSWLGASQELPAAVQCADIRWVRNPDGSRLLYLSTYGRSVWVAPQTVGR